MPEPPDPFPILYEELRALAAARLRGRAVRPHPSADCAVHEVYLRLAGSGEWSDRSQFLAAAARAMRNILIDHARRRGRIKRGGSARTVSLDDLDPADPARPDHDPFALADALEALTAEDPDKVRLVELRTFAGMTLDEAAVALGISRATAARYWAYAKAWLFQRLTADDAAK